MTYLVYLSEACFLAGLEDNILQYSQNFFVENYESWAKKIQKLLGKKPKTTAKYQFLE